MRIEAALSIATQALAISEYLWEDTMNHQCEDKFFWEAQYWWAFSCLALAGRRNGADFQAQLFQRSADSYPAPEQVESIVDEALTFLAEVLNAALRERQAGSTGASGWEKHLRALSVQSAMDATPETSN